jgi:hypothetical protein
MKYVTVKSGPATDLSDTLLRLAEIGPRLVLMSMENSLCMAKETTDLLCLLPKIQICLPKLCVPCEIPETECPPRCVCELEWEACVGEQLQATIQITNTAAVARTFNFSATPFQGPGNPNKSVQLTPASATLQPNRSVTVNVSFTVTPEFQQGHNYNAEVLIAGAYEQCVRVEMYVRREQRPHCVVKQGEIPTRIVAHDWWKHFQCIELCEPPIKGPAVH